MTWKKSKWSARASLPKEGVTKLRAYGVYEDEDDAARAYDAAVMASDLSVKEKQARLNFADKDLQTSDYIGVRWSKSKKRWAARYKQEGGTIDIYIGSFASEKEAALSYDRVAKKHRATADLNFPGKRKKTSGPAVIVVSSTSILKKPRHGVSKQDRMQHERASDLAHNPALMLGRGADAPPRLSDRVRKLIHQQKSSSRQGGKAPGQKQKRLSVYDKPKPKPKHTPLATAAATAQPAEAPPALATRLPLATRRAHPPTSLSSCVGWDAAAGPSNALLQGHIGALVHLCKSSTMGQTVGPPQRKGQSSHT